VRVGAFNQLPSKSAVIQNRPALTHNSGMNQRCLLFVKFTLAPSHPQFDQYKIDDLILFLRWHSTFSLGVGIGEKLEHRLIADHFLQLHYIMYTYNG
jgi:hypothetical protein